MPVARKPPDRFHHGDLRRALLDAVAEAVLERSPEALSLRDVAQRAGVAHSAAAPHFGDKRGLMTAFVTEALLRLAAAQRTEMAAAPPGARAQLAASGRGYLRFSRDNPGHFRMLMRGPPEDAPADAALQAAQVVAWAPLAEAVAAGTPGLDAATREARMLLAWAGVHGMAALMAERVAPAAMALAEEEMLAGLVEACLRP